MNPRERIARRIGKFFKNGDLVNLGIGMPTMVANYLPEGLEIMLHSENGMIGLGPTPSTEEWDRDVINAGCQPASVISGGYCCDSAMSFALIRGGHVSATVLGALEVDQEGSLANWIVPGKTVPGMGGAMDLVAGSKITIAAMEHCTKDGASKVLKKCTLPLTGYRCVDYIVTELCVLKPTDEGLVLLETAPGVTVDEIIAKTDADLIIPAVVGSME